MKCKYCEEETTHKKGCPEIVTDMSKDRAIKEFDAGRMTAGFYSLKEDATDSYRLGHEMGWKDVANHPANC
jgi:hypothetical protein